MAVPDADWLADSGLDFLQPTAHVSRETTATTRQMRRVSMAFDGLSVARAVEQIVGPLINLKVQVIVELFKFDKLGCSTKRADERATTPVRIAIVGS